MRHYYLGVDIGTTSAKAVAYNSSYEIIGRQSMAYPMQHPGPDRSEQDPEQIARAVAGCINELVSALLPARPELVAFSAAMHSLLALDAAGRPLTPCIIWADNRAAGIAAELHREGKAMAFYRATGVPVHAMSPLCKLIWLRREQPDVFRGAAAFVGIKEYVFARLFGQRPLDTSIASATGLLNSETLDWEEEILRHIDIDRSKLGRLVSPRHVLYYQPAEEPPPNDGQEPVAGDVPNFRAGVSGKYPAAAGVPSLLPLRLPAGTPVVVGCSDGACANLATGAIGESVMAVTIGTSGAVRMIVDAVPPDPEMRTFRYHVKDGLYITGGATNNGAVVLQWLREQWLGTGESYEQLFELAGGVPAGAEGLLFIPYILGERAPVWNPGARGVFFGVDVRHTRAHLVRAAMEGVLYGLYAIGEILGRNRKVEALHATGGFARSALWLQILADMFQTEVVSFGEEDSAALGAVTVGLEALGKGPLGPLDRRTPQAVYRPEAGNRAIYRQQSERFWRLYRLVEGEF